MKPVLLSGIILREFSNSGKLGSGFKLHFYESQTDTRKAVYTDVAGTIPATNPVICNASGYPGAIYGKGLYRVLITDNFDIQVVPPIDNFGADVGADGDATYVACVNYDEVRALTSDYDFAYVCGREDVGDGGQGLFQRITESETDDDGVVLTNSAGNVVWKRVFSGYIDPQWYGLKYNAILSQSAPLEKAMLASFRFHIPVRITDHVYIDQSIEFVEGSALVADEGAVFTATFGNTILISGDSDIKGRLFGENIKAEFGSRYSKIYISWFGGQTDDDRLLKLYQAATNATQILVVNETLNIGTDINIGQPFTFEGGVLNVNTGCSNLLLPAFLDPSYISKIFNVTTSLTAIVIGRRHVLPEYFGAKGDASTNDSAAFQLAVQTGLVKVIAGHTYKLSTQINLPDTLEVVGAGILNIQQHNLSCDTLTLDQCSVTYSGSELWFDGTNLFATNCTISNKYQVANTKVINGCAYIESNLYPIFDGTTGPAIYGAHLPLIVDSASLYTDINGKIQGRSWQVGKSWTVTNYVGNGQYYNALRYLNGNWIIIGNDGLIKTSTDMINWTVRNSGTTVFLSDVTWNGTYYVVCGDSSTYLRSSDLVTWTPSVSKPTTTGVPVFMATNGSRFVTTDRINGQIVSSADGLNWSSVYSFGGSSGSQCSYGNGAFLCGGNNGNLAYSTDGITFVAKSCPSSPQFYTSFYDTLYSRWIMFSAGTVAISTDPSTNNWVTYPTGQTETIYFALRVDDTIVAVGANGRIMTSPDGRYWTNRYSGTSAFMYGSAVNGHDLYATGAGELIIKADYI